MFLTVFGKELAESTKQTLKMNKGKKKKGKREREWDGETGDGKN